MKKIIAFTFDTSRVDAKTHAALIGLMDALGYIVVKDETGVEGEVQNQEEQPLSIPQLTPFAVPAGSTINSAKEGLPMDDYCRDNLTNENFPCEPPKGPIAGGFLPMDKNFESEEGVSAVAKLAEQTGRKFRVGTTHECLLFKKRHPGICPKNFIALGTVWNGEVLRWYGDCTEFGLDDWGGKWYECHQVFLVEDL